MTPSAAHSSTAPPTSVSARATSAARGPTARSPATTGPSASVPPDTLEVPTPSAAPNATETGTVPVAALLVFTAVARTPVTVLVASGPTATYVV